MIFMCLPAPAIKLPYNMVYGQFPIRSLDCLCIMDSTPTSFMTVTITNRKRSERAITQKTHTICLGLF